MSTQQEYIDQAAMLTQHKQHSYSKPPNKLKTQFYELFLL